MDIYPFSCTEDLQFTSYTHTLRLELQDQIPLMAKLPSQKDDLAVNQHSCPLCTSIISRQWTYRQKYVSGAFINTFYNRTTATPYSFDDNACSHNDDSYYKRGSSRGHERHRVQGQGHDASSQINPSATPSHFEHHDHAHDYGSSNHQKRASRRESAAHSRRGNPESIRSHRLEDRNRALRHVPVVDDVDESDGESEVNGDWAQLALERRHRVVHREDEEEVAAARRRAEQELKQRNDKESVELIRLCS